MRHRGRAVGQMAGLLFGAGLSLASVGCGDGVVEPIVADLVTPTVEPTPVDPVDSRLSGLCGACPTEGRCGSENDLCLERPQTGERFCGRDCDERGRCPEGYECRGLNNSDESQCVPENGTCRGEDQDVPPLAVLRASMLEGLNELRADADRSALMADTCLDELAQSAALDLALYDETSGAYQDTCGWAFETRAVVARYDLRWQEALTALWENPSITSRPRDFLSDLSSEDWVRVGIGILLAGDEAFLTLSYGRY